MDLIDSYVISSLYNWHEKMTQEITGFLVLLDIFFPYLHITNPITEFSVFSVKHLIKQHILIT